MTQTLTTQPIITWEKLPEDFVLPDDPVENLNHPLLAATLREILEIAEFITPKMLIGSNFALCAKVDKKIVVKAPDWFYVPSVFPIEASITRRSYTPHTEGDVPAVVMEFLSENIKEEYSSKSTYPYGKWYFYERILQVPMYIIFDPDQGLLEVHSLKSGHYELQDPDENGRYLIDSMNLYLGVWHGTKSQITSHWLRWWDTTGNLLPWANERIQQSFQQGIEQGKLELITRLLTRKFGEIDPNNLTKINNLSPSNLNELSDTLLDFPDLSALSTWLDQH